MRGRPETKCPRTNVLGTLVPKLIVPCDVPGLIHLCHYSLYNTFRLVENDRDVSMQGQCLSGTIHFGDQGSEKIRTGTHCFETSRHPTVKICQLLSSLMVGKEEREGEEARNRLIGKGFPSISPTDENYWIPINIFKMSPLAPPTHPPLPLPPWPPSWSYSKDESTYVEDWNIRAQTFSNSLVGFGNTYKIPIFKGEMGRSWLQSLLYLF